MKKVVKASTYPDKLEWDELNGSDQLAIEYAIQFINDEHMDMHDAIIRAVDQVNNASMEPEYDREMSFWEDLEGKYDEANKKVVRYYLEDHPELINPQPRPFRKTKR